MNCQTFQNRVLSLTDPRELPGPLGEHASACAACSAWWRTAAKLEGLLAVLPVPPAPSDKKSELLEELAGPVIRPLPAFAPKRGLWSIPAVRTFSGIAASVAILVGGWMMLRPGPGTPSAEAKPSTDPFLERIVQRDLALAQARTADQRLDVLGSLADDLSTEARSLSKIANPEELRDLSGMFQKVVNEGMVEQARRMPEHSLSPVQKKELYNRLAVKLKDAGRHADDAAKESPPHAQPALKTISDTARDGQAKLKAILGVQS
jgi:hypothetical protein